MAFATWALTSLSLAEIDRQVRLVNGMIDGVEVEILVRQDIVEALREAEKNLLRARSLVELLVGESEETR